MTNWRSARRGDPSDSGASAVEFALVMPVLLLFIYGIVAFGFVFSQQISLNNAARDASRAGVVLPLTGSALGCDTIASQARTGVANSVGIGAASLQTVVVDVSGPAGTCQLASGSTTTTGTPSTAFTPCTGATSNSVVTVTLSYRSKPPVPLVSLANINLKSSGIFQCEYK